MIILKILMRNDTYFRKEKKIIIFFCDKKFLFNNVLKNYKEKKYIIFYKKYIIS